MAFGASGSAGCRQRHTSGTAARPAERLPSLDRGCLPCGGNTERLRTLNSYGTGTRVHATRCIGSRFHGLGNGERARGMSSVRRRFFAGRISANAIAGTIFERLPAGEKLELNAVVNYELPIPEIVSRLSGRRTCSNCKAVFHVVNQPPKKEGICDHCGGALLQREDDRPESVKVRLAAYEESTAPLIAFYGKLGLVVSVAATGSPEEICGRTLESLNKHVRRPVSAG